MAILLPVNGLAPPEALPLAVFSGGRELSASPTVAAQLVPRRFNGKRVMTVMGGLMVRGAATLSGARAITALGRIDDEANVFGAATLTGGRSLTVGSGLGVGSNPVLIAGTRSLAINPSVTRAEELSFTFFVDISDADVTAALNTNIRRYSARLTADGVSIPIISARLNAPEDRLGTELSVVLARADVSQVALSASIDFELGIYAAGAFVWLPILTGGKLSSRSARYANAAGAPADSVELTIVDVMGDRWNRAPRQQTILYDPQTVDAPSADTITAQTIYTSAGAALVPLYRAIAGMRLRDVLAAAYVTGCGFNQVITNIDNFAVEQAVFSLSGGFDAGVRGLIAVFEPIVFVVGNDLWIVTLDNPLPSGFDARELSAASITGLDDAVPGREPVNAMLVRLKDNSTGEFYTERVDTKTETSGTYGTPDYTQTETERRVREYRNFATPTVVTREDEVSLRARTIDFEFNEISIETRVMAFDQLNRPAGYRRTMEALLPDLENSAELLLQTSEEETQNITYAPHPLHPERDVQHRIETLYSGLILTDNDNTYLDKPYRLPLRDAHKSGYVSADANQETHFGALKTVSETIRVSGGQVFRDRRVTNHVAGVPDQSATQVLPGDASFDRRRESGRTRTVLLTIAGTDAGGRRVAEFDGTGLPSDVALRLAEKKLQRLNAPPRSLSVSLPFVDPSLRRGTDLNVRGRSGSLGTYIVRGYSITVARNDEGVSEATMSLNARELK